MLEVFDKLLSSFGIDAFDFLYWNTKHKADEWYRVLSSFLIVTVYVVFHSFLYFAQITTLTVATNSTDQAMITVMILNNFTEIKSSVFKKFDKNNLFQLACSDITERFQLCLFMTLILFTGMAQAGTSCLDLLPSSITIIVILIFCEAVADWIKHAFIIKINQLEPSLYNDYASILRSDVLNRQKDNIVLERTYGIARRLGFPQIPMACVFVRYLILILSTPTFSAFLSSLQMHQIILISAIVFCIALVVKVNVGIGLILYAGRHKDDELKSSEIRRNKSAGDTGGTSSPDLKSKESILRLSDIERYSGRIVG